jgi:3-carboxy-cis,cis-muconate cycloisomerase
MLGFGFDDLAHELRQHADLVAQLGGNRIDELCNPANYRGSAHTVTTNVINT